MSDFLIFYSVFSYTFMAGALWAMDLRSKHIPGALFMFIFSPILIPVLIGYGFVVIADK